MRQKNLRQHNQFISDMLQQAAKIKEDANKAGVRISDEGCIALARRDLTLPAEGRVVMRSLVTITFHARDAYVEDLFDARRIALLVTQIKRKLAEVYGEGGLFDIEVQGNFEPLERQKQAFLTRNKE